MLFRDATVLISCVCSLSATLLGCGTLDLQATTLGQQTATEEFRVSGNRLLDPCGDPVILRGVNEMVTFLTDKKSGATAFEQIAKTRANSVRLYWRTFEAPADLDRLLSNAEARHLLPIVYVFNEPAQIPARQIFPTKLTEVTQFWLGSEILPIVMRHQSWLVIALREKGDQEGEWATRYNDAIATMRAAGVTVPLAIDAPASGTDVEGLLEFGQARIAADPSHNLLLNVNAGAQDDTPEHIADALNRAANTDPPLPLLVGEISGWAHTSLNECAGQYDFDVVLQAADATGTGWLGWSWGTAKNNPCEHLDMTDSGTFGSWPEDWGRLMAVDSDHSISKTSQPISYVPGGACR